MPRTQHNDESELSVFLNRELESRDPRTFTDLYEGLVMRSLVPKIPNIGVYDLTYGYDIWSTTGQADFIGEHAGDLPSIQVGRRPVSLPMKPLGASMDYSVLTLRSAMKGNIPFEDMTQKAASRSVMKKVDKVLAIGDAKAGITGLFNDAEILANNAVAPVNAYATAADVLASLNKLIATTRARVENVSQIHEDLPTFGKFHIVLPPVQHTYIFQTPASANYPDSIYDVFMRQNKEWCSGISSASYLQTIHAGNKPRGICYPLNDVALGAAIADDEFVREAPQFDGLDVSVPVFTTTGGCVLRFKPAFSYMLLGA